MPDTVEDARSSEEWQEWMDWSKVSDDELRSAQKLSPSAGDITYQLPSPQSSVTSEPLGLSSRKRKLSTEYAPQTQAPGPPANDFAKANNISHSIVEKRYRTNLNQKISELGDCIPVFRANAGAKPGASEGLKRNKATVLSEAIAYIKNLECRNKYLEEANDTLRRQAQHEVIKPADGRPVELAERSLDSTKSAHSSSPGSATTGSEEPSSKKTDEDDANARPAQGMIQVPSEWKRMWRGELRRPSELKRQDSAKGHQNEEGRISTSGRRYVNRLMAGSLAGLMVVDTLNNSEDVNDRRGLSSIPIVRHLPRRDSFRSLFRLPSLPNEFSMTTHSNLYGSFLKGFLLFGILGLLLFIYLFTSRPPSRRKSNSSTPVEPQPAPSVASPLEVRQRAFLTAIQTIWFPRHHALPEMLALNLETAAYIIRQLLGWQMYSWLTGRSEDEEVARVRAWDIAIDAQLSGGDPEISKSRLVLSLWASGTLPRSPARFMLKALHIRILFWQPSRWLWLNRQFHAIALSLANWQWNKGHKLQLNYEEPNKTQGHGESLTDHLRTLLSRPSFEVMKDDNLQKAHRLVWNNSIGGRSCSDSMHEDTAMRGPLDALASWCSSAKLRESLDVILKKSSESHDAHVSELIDLSYDLAPPASVHRARALAGKALMSKSKWMTHLHDLISTVSSISQQDQDLTSERLLAGVKALSKDLSGSDATDIYACALASVGAYDMEGGLNTSRELNQLIITDGTALGLLGWAAIRHRLLTTSKPLRASIAEDISQACNMLSNSEVLDAPTQFLLQEPFKNLRLQKGMSTKHGRRRISGSSHDTGYESMSEEIESEGC